MPADSKVGRRHWGWLILLVTFWKFQHFNLVSKIFQNLFKPLPCHKSIGKMLHAICISAVAVSLRWASCGPWASCSPYMVMMAILVMWPRSNEQTFISSPEHQVLLVSYCDPVSCGVSNCFKSLLLWRPSWKSIFRFFSWPERPVDSKLGRKHQCDL